ncbi:hypothetical protein B4S56_000239 [Escherichia coli]|nr:hypothetical protein [Escherichia coli]
MITITKERLLTIKEWRETYGPGSNVVLPAEEAEELARIALASLEAEPVAECIVEDGGMCIDGFGEYVGHSLPDGTHQLYTAPPAPVVPEEKPMPNPLSMYAVDAVAAIAEVRGWNACRAAILHGSEPVSQAYKLPPMSSNAVNDAAWKLHNMLTEHGPLNGCQFNNLKECFYEALKVAMRNYPDIPDSSVPAPGKGVTGERIRIKPHVYRELVNRLHDTAIKCAGTQQLRERISRVLGDVITPDHHKQVEKSGLERCHLEAALNIKPGHTLGIIDALLVHKMARALLPLAAEKHEADHANES